MTQQTLHKLDFLDKINWIDSVFTQQQSFWENWTAATAEIMRIKNRLYKVNSINNRANVEYPNKLYFQISVILGNT